MPDTPHPLIPSQSSVPLWITDDALSGLIDLGMQLGIDLEPDLDRHGLLDQALDPGKAMMPVTAFVELLEGISARHACPNFGFLLGRLQKPLSYGLISQVPRLCATLGKAFGRFSQYSRLYSGSFSWRINVEDGVAIMRRHETTGYHRPMVQMITYSLTIAFTAFRHIVGERWQPDGIYFTHDAPPDPEPLRRFFQTPIFFGSEFCGIAFPESSLEIPIATADPDLLGSLVAYFDNLLAADPVANSLELRVSHEIKSQLGGHGSTLNNIAHRFDMHPRAFQRALAVEGLSFRKLYNRALVDVAIHLLGSSNAAVADIAYMLGFAHPSALARAVKAQTGMSPTQLRQSSRQPVTK